MMLVPAVCAAINTCLSVGLLGTKHLAQTELPVHLLKKE